MNSIQDFIYGKLLWMEQPGEIEKNTWPYVKYF